MNRNEIIDTLTPIVREVFNDSALEIKDDMSADNVSGWTSLSFMQLLAKIEEEYSFKFKIFELISIHNMGDLLQAVAKHCS